MFSSGTTSTDLKPINLPSRHVHRKANGFHHEQNQKPAQNASRAREEGQGQVSKALAKVIKKAAQIADLMTSEDVEQDLKVLRDAKKATHHVYDTRKKRLGC
jgi:hypothetical protein